MCSTQWNPVPLVLAESIANPPGRVKLALFCLEVSLPFRASSPPAVALTFVMVGGYAGPAA